VGSCPILKSKKIKFTLDFFFDWQAFFCLLSSAVQQFMSWCLNGIWEILRKSRRWELLGFFQSLVVNFFITHLCHVFGVENASFTKPGFFYFYAKLIVHWPKPSNRYLISHSEYWILFLKLWERPIRLM